jgi:hypothetical protein
MRNDDIALKKSTVPAESIRSPERPLRTEIRDSLKNKYLSRNDYHHAAV